MVNMTNDFEVEEGIFLLYDVFIQNGEIYCIGPLYKERNCLENNEILYKKLKVAHGQMTCRLGNETAKSRIIPDPHNHTLILIFSHPLIREHEESMRPLDVEIQATGTLKKSFVLHPEPEEACEFALSTLFYDDNHLIDRWISYHLGIGFEKFFLYNNNPANRDQYEELEAKYGPKLTFIDWGYPGGYPGGVKDTVQPPSQNHALYKYRSITWIGLFDVDEYIVPLKDKHVRQLTERVDRHRTSALSLQCMWFGCNAGAEFNEANFPEKLTARKEHPEGQKLRQKCIVNPENVDAFSIHLVLSGICPQTHIDPDIARFNHYLVLSSKKRNCEHHIFDAVQDTSIIPLISP